MVKIMEFSRENEVFILTILKWLEHMLCSRSPDVLSALKGKQNSGLLDQNTGPLVNEGSISLRIEKRDLGFGSLAGCLEWLALQ